MKNALYFRISNVVSRAALVVVAIMISTIASFAWSNQCPNKVPQNQSVSASGWGFDPSNTRFINDDIAKLAVEDIPKLKLKWAFGYPGANKARSQPAITEDTLYVGSSDGTIYALDRDTGCTRWEFEADWEVRSAISVAKIEGTTITAVFFGDFRANAYALNAKDGALLWQYRVHDHVAATITGAPKFHNNKLYVPVSSFEVALPAVPVYPCCTFRGAVVALDALSGKELWRNFAGPEPVKQGTNSVFVNRYGPSGAPIWNSPTIDEKRNVLYVGTGENYSSPASDASDAILAFDLDTGELKWKNQLLAGDAWNIACILPIGVNCPEGEKGVDLDIGASPILARVNDKDFILVGQKSGAVYALDPDNQGKTVWQEQVGRGGVLGGVHWGMALDSSAGDGQLYVPISDYDHHIPGLNSPDAQRVEARQPSLSALDVATGRILWKKMMQPICGNSDECDPALSAAVSAIPGAVFAGGLDGFLRAFDSQSGDVIWQVDTAIEVEGVNGVKGNGGAIDADGAVIVDGSVYINSGYGLFGAKSGNLLLVYSVDGK